LDEKKASIIRLRADLSFRPKPKCTLTSSGYRVEVLPMGCSSTCASIMMVSSLPTLRPEVRLIVCEEAISIKLSGVPIPKSNPILIVHNRCDLELGGRTLVLPCGEGALPTYLEVSSVREEMQEIGLNLRGKVLYKGDLSIYLLQLPTGGELIAGAGGSIIFNPGSYLLITEAGRSRLKVDGEELILP